MISRIVGGGAAGFITGSLAGDIPRQGAKLCTPQVWSDTQSLFSGGIFTPENALKIKTNFLNCTTLFSSGEALRDFGLGTAGVVLVIIDSVLNKSEREMGKWSAAWEGVKAACVQATPYIIDSYLHLYNAQQMVHEYHNSVIDNAVGYGGLAIAAVGIAQVSVSAIRVGRSLFIVARDRQAQIDEKRAERIAQTAQLKEALEDAVATGKLPEDPALAALVTELVENTQAWRQVEVDSRQQAIRERENRGALRRRRQEEAKSAVPQPTFSLDDVAKAVSKVLYQTQKWRFERQKMLKVNKVDPKVHNEVASSLPLFLSSRGMWPRRSDHEE